ncbi:MAG: GEVED domain-containing protein [Bacteroidia bacterium]|nr:GEVED domain-containing protein [Bacteroidia bacterium]
MYLADPAGTSLLFKTLLFQGLDPISSLQGITSTGGRLNLLGALERVDSLCSTLSADCLPAFALKATQLTDSSATLQWASGDSAIGYFVRFRVQGESAWADSFSTLSPVLALNNLQRCEQYQFQVRVFCQNDTIDYVASGFFRSEGCCEPPSGRELLQVSDSSLLFRWKSVFGANGYEYRIREIGDTLFLSGQTTDTTLFISGLTACREYEWQLATLCDSLDLDFSAWEQVSTIGCGTCQDSIYCVSVSTDTEFEWINRVEIGNLVNGSGNNQGYKLFAGPAPQFFRDSTITLTLFPGYNAVQFDEWWRIWIDLDQNGEFNDSTEKLFDSQVGIKGNVNGSLTIPGLVPLGSTRMRVSMKFSGLGSGGGPQACGTFEGGEVEDYCIVVVDSDSSCGAVTIQELSYSPLIQRLYVSGDTIHGASGYLITLTGPGFPSGVMWQSVSPVWEGVIALQSCESYEITMQAICNGVAGAASTQTLNTAGCGSCIDLNYCVAEGLAADSVWLEGFRLNSLVLQTGTDGGYVFFSGQSIDLNATGSLTGWIIPEGIGQDSVFAEMWIDVDGDGILLTDERVFSRKVLLGDTIKIGWLVPQNISTDGGRIRLMVSRESIANSCFSPLHGEVEDLCFVGKTVGVENGLDTGVDIFPNPFTDRLEIQSDWSVQSIRFFDLQGRQVAVSTEGNGSKWSVGTAELPSGIYLIEIRTARGLIRQKVWRE